MTASSEEPLARSLCSDIRDTCILGNTVRRGRPVLDALREALDDLLYQGVRPSRKPLTRAEAVEKLLAQHCDTHRRDAEQLLAALTPPGGLPRTDEPPSTQ